MILISKRIQNQIDDILKTKKGISKQSFIYQVERLKETISTEVDNFDVDKDYLDIYTTFRKSVEEKYLYIFTDILDIVARIIIDEIYFSIDSLDEIEIEFDPIKKASSKKRNHFEVAKSITKSIIKMYSLNPNSSKRIITYIDELLPDNYTKNSDIDFVVWYFLVCIITLNKNLRV